MDQCRSAGPSTLHQSMQTFHCAAVTGWKGAHSDL